MATTTTQRKRRVGKNGPPPSGRNRKVRDAAHRDQAPSNRSESDALRSRSNVEARAQALANGSSNSGAASKKQSEKEGGKRNGRERERRVRDTFSMPAKEYEVIAELKKRCSALGIEVKKSELLRVGLGLIRALPDARLAELVRPLVAARAERSSGSS